MFLFFSLWLLWLLRLWGVPGFSCESGLSSRSVLLCCFWPFGFLLLGTLLQPLCWLSSQLEGIKGQQQCFARKLCLFWPLSFWLLSFFLLLFSASFFPKFSEETTMTYTCNTESAIRTPTTTETQLRDHQDTSRSTDTMRTYPAIS